MGVLLQAFYWDCPRLDGQEYRWWNYVAGKLPELARAGFTALWLPPASKGANIGGMSMGYDVYDYYDLGSYPQKGVNKGEVRTWFGSEKELRALIKKAHRAEIKVYADLVLNHNNGADAAEYNPISQREWWTRFNPQSGLFTRDWTCFNPSPYQEWDQTTFGDMPDLCHINPRVSTGILNHAKWLVEEIGFDGFRYDFVKGFGAWIVRAIHDRQYKRDGKAVEIFGVGECWAGDTFIDNWLDAVNSWAQSRVGAFDFPLRYRLKDLCDSYGFSLRRLAEGGVVMRDRPFEAVTFVDNHDFPGSAGVVHDKLLAYAFILTHEGYPCVFWQDWFNYGLAKTGAADGLERLVQVHESHAGGSTSLLHVDDLLYVMERSGFDQQSGLLFGLNNAGGTLTQQVQCRFHGAPLRLLAANRSGAPQTLQVDARGWCDLSVPPRGYVVYGI